MSIKFTNLSLSVLIIFQIYIIHYNFNLSMIYAKYIINRLIQIKYEQDKNRNQYKKNRKKLQ
jgi:hypothetical protein